jgi:1-deoxy-D-xylulose-5-phosphate reductoisomerase
MRQVAVLGSTGSIGVNALDVIQRLNRAEGGFRVAALSTYSHVPLLQKQIQVFRPSLAVVGDEAAAKVLSRWARSRKIPLRVMSGVDGLVQAASAPAVQLVLSAVVGAVGLQPLLSALRAKKTVALANKEALIVAGEIVMATARRYGAKIIPVDSEHSAMFQCLGGRTGPGAGVRRLILTASGGAFYRRTGSLDQVGVEEALNHPTWKMGRKITVDCATLTNKGLEAIEAHYLFGVPLDRIQIVIHPQSIVHSLVEFEDGSSLAQLSHPDMRLPIQYALTYPDRKPTPVRALALDEIKKLEFYAPDFRRFPALSLALEAGRRGGAWPAVFNGANEAAVQAFLGRRLPFTGIPRLCRQVMNRFKKRPPPRDGLRGILEADAWARREALSFLGKERLSSETLTKGGVKPWIS